jgi:hypothetical protein
VGDALNWLKMYLSERSHSTHVLGVTSQPLPLKMGVPQGSTLGPLLFSMYITDLGKVISGTGVRYEIYADDVQLIVNVKPNDLEIGIKTVETCLTTIEKWTSNNYLQLNTSKTEIMIVGSKDQLAKIPKSDLSINGIAFISKNSFRDLGVIIDHHLKMDRHIDNICRVAYSHLRSIHRLRKSLNHATTSILVHSLVLSRIDACTAVLHGTDKSQLKKLQRVIKATFRVTYQLKKRDRISKLMKEKGWLSIDERIVLRLAVITFNVIKFGKPVYLSELITPSSSEHGLRSQARGDLTVKFARSKLGSRAFSVAIPMMWNKIIKEVRESQNRNSFKNKMKKMLLQT